MSFSLRPILPHSLSICLLGASLQAKLWTLADQNLSVAFDDQTGLITAQEHNSGQVWRQTAPNTRFTVQQVTADPGRLVVALDGPFPMEMTLTLSLSSDLEVTLTADPATPLKKPLAFPGPFATPDESWNLVMPEAEGLLMPISKVGELLHPERPISVYDMSGLFMPWIGVTDGQLDRGCMTIIDTPFDVSVSLATRQGPAAPSPLWEPEMGRFGYARSLRYHFFGTGGYVAQAKHYRDYVQRTREFTTLRERALTRPAIDRLVGGVHIYTWDDGRTLDLARELKAAGIDRAWIGWDPDHPPYPKPGYTEGLTALGFLSGVYDLYRDIYSDVEFAERTQENPTLGELWLHRYDYHGIFEGIVARNADGSPMDMVRSMDVNLMRYWVCTKAVLPHLAERMTRERAVYPHESVFLDVTLAAGPIECASPDHPMTHRQDAAARLEIHRYMADDLGMVVGSEAGADYGIAHTEFMHGVVSLHHFFGDRRGPRDQRDTDAPTYRGDWSDTARPSMMLGEHEPTDLYWEVGLNPAFRVPLYELVYHDCTVTSWRWNDNSHKQPSTWARKDLFNALYANAPQWNLDQATWERHRERFVTSFTQLNPLLRQVGYEEMTDHRFLNTERSLQESRFANGSRIIVNFADRAAQVGEVTIAANSFVLIQP